MMLGMRSIAPGRNASWSFDGQQLLVGASIHADNLSRGREMPKEVKTDWQRVLRYVKGLYGFSSATELTPSDRREMHDLAGWTQYSSIERRAYKLCRQIYPWAERNIHRMERILEGQSLSAADYLDLAVFLAETSMALGEPKPYFRSTR